MLDQDLVIAVPAGLIRSGKDHPHNDRKLVMKDLGWHHCSVKPDVDRVGSRIVAEVCSGGGLDPLNWCATLGSTNLWVAIFWVPIVSWVQGAKQPCFIHFAMGFEFGILVEDMVF